MKKFLLPFLMAVFILALASCGPSTAEKVTPSVPTMTPAPAVPTSIPYNLTVKVTDQSGNPITWATGILQSSGTNLPMDADATGQIVWNNMPNAEGLLSVSAQGYKPAQQTLNLEQGQNELSIVLEIDPTQLNPGKACQPGQKALYVEDFEDGRAQDLDNIEAPKWNFVKVDDHGTVLSVNAPGGNASTTNWTEFGNAVWMFDLSTNAMIDIDINWHIFEVSEGSNAGLSRYFVVYKPGELFELNYQRPGEGNNILAEAESPVFQENTWHTFAIAFFDGALSVWVDGQQAMGANQDLPIQKGSLGIQINAATQAEILLDNFIVCELKGPYTGSTVTP